MKNVTYNVYRDGVRIAENVKDNFYTDSNLDPDTTYKYQVSAVNEYGESELSNTVTVTTEKTEEETEEEVEEDIGEDWRFYFRGDSPLFLFFVLKHTLHDETRHQYTWEQQGGIINNE